MSILGTFITSNMTHLDQDDGVDLMDCVVFSYVRHGLADLSFDPFIMEHASPQSSLAIQKDTRISILVNVDIFSIVSKCLSCINAFSKIWIISSSLQFST